MIRQNQQTGQTGRDRATPTAISAAPDTGSHDRLSKQLEPNNFISRFPSKLTFACKKRLAASKI